MPRNMSYPWRLDSYIFPLYQDKFQMDEMIKCLPKSSQHNSDKKKILTELSLFNHSLYL